MGSYTPNLNLYKPDSSDDLSDFRTEFNNNMDKLDNGGGGSATLAGLTDVDIQTPSDGDILAYNSVTQKWENEANGGGDSVSWSQIQQSGTKIAEITINGVSTDVYAPQGGGSFSALIIITDTTGLTITATKGGDTYTATETSAGIYEVNVDSMGTWTIDDGSNTASVVVSAQTTYYVALGIPDGSTALPTDDVQLLLNCADVWDKAYTTVAELLADSATLATVLSDNNAADYLVRSTTFASEMCANQTAMYDIGLSDYTSFTLLGDGTWRAAICSSSYYQSVLNTKVPAMSSDTTPSGKVIYSSSWGSYPVWKMFDGNTGTEGIFTAKNNQWYGYKFTQRVLICKIWIYRQYDRTISGSVTLEASNDGSTWVPIQTLGTVGQTNNYYTVLANNTAYQYWRVANINTGDNQEPSIYESNFYGRADSTP